MSDREEPTVEGTATAADALVQNTTSRRIRPPPRLTMERRQALESLMSTSAIATTLDNNNTINNNSSTPSANNPYVRDNNNATTSNNDNTTTTTATNINNDTATNNNNNSPTIRNRSNPWPPKAIEFFEKIRKDIEKKVAYKYGNGRVAIGKFHGSFPEKYKGIVSPSRDPLSFFGTNQPLTMDHFILPDAMVWYPEAQYPDLYPAARPKCKWHGHTDCVMHDGWMHNVRHGYAEPRIIGIIGRRYYCKTRKALGNEHSFRGIDRVVIEQSHNYVRQVWAKIGFDVSHRSAIAMKDLERLRSNLNQGLGISGFRRCMIESMRVYHMRTAIQWSSYVNHLEEVYNRTIHNRDELPIFLNQTVVNNSKRYYAKFLSDIYHQPKPSHSYLIARVILLMERDASYNIRRMQLVDGKHLSGDHSFKLAKCVIAGGSKAFTAMYIIMNEFGQVVAWWFTSGTSMDELKESIKKLKQRYTKLGYDHPESFTTDRCCHERTYWNAIFSFLDTHISTAGVDEEDLATVNIVQMPFEERAVAYNGDVATLYVSEIYDYINSQPRELKVIVVDCEWTVGQPNAEVVIVDTMEESAPYIFSLSEICKGSNRFPQALKGLLEDSNVKKVGNRICSDISKMRGWGVTLGPTIELGHEARARAITPTRAPSLSDIVGSLFNGAEMDGKSGDSTSPRVSSWNGKLSDEQCGYASNDGYSTRKAYQRLKQIMDPKVQQPLLVSDIAEGVLVTLYSDGWKTRVANGKLTGNRVNNSRVVIVEIDINNAQMIFALGEYQ